MTLEHLAGLEHHPFRGALAGPELLPPPWGTASWRYSKPSSLQAKTKARSLGGQVFRAAADAADMTPAWDSLQRQRSIRLGSMGCSPEGDLVLWPSCALPFRPFRSTDLIWASLPSNHHPWSTTGFRMWSREVSFPSDAQHPCSPESTAHRQENGLQTNPSSTFCLLAPLLRSASAQARLKLAFLASFARVGDREGRREPIHL